MTFYEVYYGLKYANELLWAKMKKKITLREKESNEIFKVKNLCICSAMIKKHTRVHFAPIKTLLLSKNGNSSNQTKLCC